jgi:PAS domain S-box-containing protein
MNKVNIIQNLSIKNKIIAIILLVTILMISLGFIFIAMWDINRLKTETQSGLVLNAKLVGNYCVVPLTFDDNKQATDVLSRLQYIEFIEIGCLYDKEGNLFAQYPDTLNEKSYLVLPEQQNNVFTDGHFYVSEPVMFQNEMYGTIYIEANSSPLTNVKKTIILTLSLLTLVLVLLTAFIASRMQKYISLPIIKLLKHIDEIAELQDFSVHLAKQNNDEIGSLYDGFNNMLNHINKRQEELQESNEKYLNLMDSLGTGVVLHAPDTSIILSNAMASEILGVSPEQMRGIKAIDPRWKFVETDGTDMPLDEYPVNKALRLMKSFSDYFIGIKRPDREYITWVNVNASLVYDKNNNIKYVNISFNDTTEQKQAEQALKESEEKLNLIINASPVGICTVDPLGNFSTTNLAYERMVGYSKEECRSLSFFDVTHPNDRPKNKELFQSMFSLDATGFSMKKRYVRKDGSEIDVAVHAIGIMDAEGNVRFGTAFVDDITERKQIEEDIKKSQLLLQQAEEISNQGAWEWDIVQDKWAFSQNWLSIHGCRLSGITREELMTIAYPEDAPEVEKAFQDALKGSSPYNVEHRIVRQNDGEVRHVRAKGKLILDDSGQSVKMCGVAQDVTDSKLAEEALRHQFEITKTITDNAASCLFMMDKHGHPTFMNPAAERICGYTLEEIRDMSLHDAIHYLYPNGRPYPMSECPIDNAQADLKEMKNYEDIFVRKDGSLFPVICYIAPLEQNGEVIGSVLEFRDVTQQKLAEEALRESEEKLNALFTSLTEMIVMHELVLNAAGEAVNYRIIDCNKVFTEVTGIPKEDAVGKLASEVYQTDLPPYLEKYAKVALGGEPHEFNAFYPPLNKHFMISVVSPHTGMFATITTDITAMMQIQEMIMAKNKEMENYLYVTSHDLRTPLVNIQGFSQRLKKQADSLKALFTDITIEPEILHQLAIITDEDIPKTLSFVLSNIEKMDTLINGLLKLSRTGTIELNIQKIDMNALFEKILQSLDFQIKEAQCEIHIDSLPGCYGDAALLDQLFANIISNALKYSDSERALKITVTAKQTYNIVVYTIRDTGKGIGQKHLDKIWDVFYRIDRRSGKTGEGIGLSLVKRIVEKHKGKVWAESDENKGSAFHIELNNRSFTEL